MPLYVYEVINQPGERFEIFQKISDPPLKYHPQTKLPVKRIIYAPSVPSKRIDLAAKENVADDSRLEKLGFTKYVKSKDGTYEKRAGRGPDVISKDRPISGDDLPV